MELLASHMQDDIERVLERDKKVVKPFLKWAGGKLRLLSVLRDIIPRKGERFIEPFAGAASISLNIDYKQCLINDINFDLINVYLCLLVCGQNFITDCKNLFIPENNRSDRYGQLKHEFNTSSDRYRKALLFIYLNRHCFNGLCRYNGRGEFNTPIGQYDEPYFPERELTLALPKIRKFTIECVDFREIFKGVKAGDVVYADPPYMPISGSANFDDYSQGGFSLQDHFDLALCAWSAAKRGALVVVSNHYNWYSNELYVRMFGAKKKVIDVSRTISSKTDKRESAKEILAIFHPNKI